jgi:hypothetical protein
LLDRSGNLSVRRIIPVDEDLAFGKDHLDASRKSGICSGRSDKFP